MEQIPVVSFLMSVYNGEEYLEDALKSISAQTYQNWECVVIDDCSTDSSPEILKRWAERDGRFRVSRNPENLRLAASLNRGLGLVRGRYIARFDADDLCAPDRLEKQLSFMDAHPELALSACKFFTLRGDRLHPAFVGRRCDNDGVRAMLLFFNPILHPGVIARTDVMSRYQYNPLHTCSEDLELWARIAADGGKIAIQDEYLLFYRLHDKQITATTMEKQHYEVRNIMRRFYGSCLWQLDDTQMDILLGSLYFRDNIRVNDFAAFIKELRRNNRRRKSFKSEAIDSALVEILAEYKRLGVSRSDIVRALLCFNPLFIAAEQVQRKARAKKDLAICAAAAERCGLIYLPEESAPQNPVYRLP